MKTSVRAQLAQTINLTPQLLQSIRLLQLTAPQLEMELRQALDRNPMLETDEGDDVGEAEADAGLAKTDDAAIDMAAWDELPDPAFIARSSRGGVGDEDDATARIVAGGSSDPRVRLLDQLALSWKPRELALASWWLDHTNDHGLLEEALEPLTACGVVALSVPTNELEYVRQRLLHSDWPGMAAADAGECLRAQLNLLRDSDERTLARRILAEHVDLLAQHDYKALSKLLKVTPEQVHAAVGLILSLKPFPIEDAVSQGDEHVIPDVVVRYIGGVWRASLNGRTFPRVRIAAHCEQGLSQSSGDQSVLRGLLEEARWLMRGIAMRNDTLLRTTQVLIERQQAFLEYGEEAIAPLTLREVADAIGMHESTISRITSGKYIQTPRGTFEIKRLFAVRLEGASVSGAAVKAMVKRLIDAEPPHAPLADDTIAGLLARQGVRVARRTVAKYRDQLRIAPAKARHRTASQPQSLHG